MSNKFTDDLKGTGNELKGEVKEQYGKATGDVGTQAEGKFDKLKGAAQHKLSDVKEAITNKVDELEKKFEDKKNNNK